MSNYSNEAPLGVRNIQISGPGTNPVEMRCDDSLLSGLAVAPARGLPAFSPSLVILDEAFYAALRY